ncbi:DNA-cytosine methyltransferase [Shewanella sp. MR-4]|uniref:DNA cytosine methyltransferase n=1 Tax=Shewanella sp. (strain MR-4) TaxID=60480 RepID=UPI0000DE1CBC|nr:DNA cytosine methyltransferase [Shewanella sp. MR-4]ABI40272.1 DNA-cytosine methyltransferase [Shewanella sp. MR-4]
MYQQLVEHIQNELAVLRSPVKDEELQAKVTHYLLNPNHAYGLSDNDKSAINQFVNEFCSQQKITFDQIKNEFIRYAQEREHFKFIDLFAGIGGFNLALTSQGGKAVFSSEWDKSAKITYFNNYGKTPFGDINQFTAQGVSNEFIETMIPDHDVLAGGFPCQPFSHAGVSARSALGLAHGFDCETQGTLFHSIARIAFVKQPKIVFMENVKNIVSHNNGETFSVIKETMENLGQEAEGKQSYRFYYKLVNSETLVAQRRVRCFMVCVREDVFQEFGAFKFPEFEGEPIPLRDALEELTAELMEEYTISDRLWEGHINRTQRNLDRGTGFTAHVADLNRPSNTIVARYGKDGKECLIPQDGRNPRKLTIKECANLFGYPENFWVPSSKTPAYKQFGNSVVVPVVSRISSEIVQQYGLNQ